MTGYGTSACANKQHRSQRRRARRDDPIRDLITTVPKRCSDVGNKNELFFGVNSDINNAQPSARDAPLPRKLAGRESEVAASHAPNSEYALWL